MNKLCIYCDAKHFLCEMNTEKCFTNCCHNGKVLFNNEDLYPEQLKELMISNTEDSKNFMTNIRIYNNLLAFASFGVKLVTLPTAGLQVFFVCGQTYQNSYSLNSESEKLRKYGQLYVIDNELANNIRLQNQNSKNCSLSLLTELDNLIRTINHYSI